MLGRSSKGKDVPVTRETASRDSPPRAGVLLALWVVAAVAATAGEPPPPTDPASAPRERAKFEWDFTGRRDPFEFRPFRKATRETPEKPTGFESIFGGPKPKNGERTKPGNGKNGTEVEQNVLKYATARVRHAEILLSQRQYAETAELTAEALNRIRPDQFPDARLLEKLRRLRDTAQRLGGRAKIEKSFAQLPISIEGIVWQPGNAVVLINGEVMRAGDLVEGVRIDEIRRREVIFVLEEGVRVRKQTLGEGAD